jgi:hypothetical protein
MSQGCRSIQPNKPSASFPWHARSRRKNTLRWIALVLLVTSAAAVWAQSPGVATQNERVIVKFKPAFAQQAEAEFSAATPVREMHILPGQAGSGRVQGFIRRYSARQLTPMYPAMVRARIQHGWTDAQFAEHIRQRFPVRAKRRPSALAVPEISRTYILEVSSMSAKETAQLVRQLNADPDVEFAEPEHTYSTKLFTNDPFLSTSGSWGQPYADL